MWINFKPEVMMEEIKKQRRKTVIRFCIITLISGLCGGIGSLIIGSLKDSVGNIGQIAEWILYRTAFILLPVISAVSPIYSAIRNQQLRKQLKNAGEDEEQLDRIDASLEFLISLLKVSNILCMLLFGIAAQYFIWRELKTLSLLYCGIFCMGILGMVFTERALIETVKKMNPTKQGDALDINFNKEWMQSCDEFEQSIIYQAAYKTYLRAHYGTGFLFLLLIVFSIWIKIGLLPLLCVGSIWMLLCLSYIHEARKLSRKPK